MSNCFICVDCDIQVYRPLDIGGEQERCAICAFIVTLPASERSQFRKALRTERKAELVGERHAENPR